MLSALLYPLVWAVYRTRLGQKRTDLKSILGSSGHIKKYRDLFGVDPDQLFKNSLSLFVFIVPATERTTSGQLLRCRHPLHRRSPDWIRRTQRSMWRHKQIVET
jgi:hypothetical protein